MISGSRINNGIGIRGITNSVLYFHENSNVLKNNINNIETVLDKFHKSQVKIINFSYVLGKDNFRILSLKKDIKEYSNANDENYKTHKDFGKDLRVLLKKKKYKDMLFIIGAGNESVDAKYVNGIVHYDEEGNFAPLNNVLIVGANSPNNILHGYSNYGKSVDISAPSGVAALNCVKDNKSYYHYNELGTKSLYGIRKKQFSPSANLKKDVDPCVNLYQFDGTSASAPIVSGVAALIWNLDPLLSPAEIKNLLINSYSSRRATQRWSGINTKENLTPNIRILNAKLSYDLTKTYIEKNARISEAYLSPNKSTYEIDDTITIFTKTEHPSSNIELYLSKPSSVIKMEKVDNYPSSRSRYHLYKATIPVEYTGNISYTVYSKKSNNELINKMTGSFFVKEENTIDEKPKLNSDGISSLGNIEEKMYFYGNATDDIGLSKILIESTDIQTNFKKIFVNDYINGTYKNLNSYFFRSADAGKFKLQITITDDSGQETSSEFFNVEIISKPQLGQISGISPKTAIKGQRQTFTITGNDFPQSIALSIEDCNTGSLTWISPSRVSYSCIPRSIGTKQLTGTMTAGGERLIDSNVYTIQVSEPEIQIPSLNGGVNIVKITGGFRINSREATGKVDEYQFYRSTSGGILGNRIYTSSSRYYSDTSLTDGTTYYYTIKACNTAGCSTSNQDYSRYDAPVSKPVISNFNLSEVNSGKGILKATFDISSNLSLTTVKAHCSTQSSLSSTSSRYFYEYENGSKSTGTQSIYLTNSNWAGKRVYCKIEAQAGENSKAEFTIINIRLSEKLSTMPVVSNLNVSQWTVDPRRVSVKFNLSQQTGFIKILNIHCATNSSYSSGYNKKEIDNRNTGSKSILIADFSSWNNKTVYCKIEAVSDDGKKAVVKEDYTYMSY